MLYSHLSHTWTTRSAAVNVTMREESIESYEPSSLATQQEMQRIAQRHLLVPFGMVASFLLVSFAAVMIANTTTTTLSDTSERLSTVPHYSQLDRPQ